MDLRYSDADEAFRAALREWLADRAAASSLRSPRRDDWDARRRWDTDWQRRLFDAGYAGLNWPKEYGGRDAPPSAAADLPRGDHAGAGALRRRELRRARSTPGRRSSPRARDGAEGRAPAQDPPGRRGVVPGLLGAGRGLGPRVAAHPRRPRRRPLRRHRAEDLVLVRPDRRLRRAARAHRPGRRSTRASAGSCCRWTCPASRSARCSTVLGSSEFCELFLDEVRVPVAYRVGAENDGWRVTNVTLSFERGTAFVSEIVDAMRLVEELAPLRRRSRPTGASSATSPPSSTRCGP